MPGLCLVLYIQEINAMKPFHVGVGATRPLPRDGGAEKILCGEQQSGRAPKMEEAVPKTVHQRGLDAGQSRRS